MTLMTVITIMDFHCYLKGLQPIPEIFTDQTFVNSTKSSNTQNMILPKIPNLLLKMPY